MSLQPSVASYFGKRKRLVTDDIYKGKLLKTNDDSEASSGLTTKCLNVESGIRELKPSGTAVEGGGSGKQISDATKKVKVIESGLRQQLQVKPKVQTDIRDSLKRCHEKQRIFPNDITSPVKFQFMGSLSPAKRHGHRANTLSNNESDNSLQIKKEVEEVKNNAGMSSSTKPKAPSVRNIKFSDSKTECTTEEIIKSAKQLVSKIKETQKKLSHEPNERKELSLKEIKDKIKKSSKLSELKKSINKINEHAEELIELEKRKLTGTQPKLSKFVSLNVEVPVSPSKNALYRSPVKEKASPMKPAYERFASLIDKTTSLPLPFRYQILYELFRSVDTVCSIMLNRGEVITFNKLKPAVEEMTRKNFTPRHLGQMATVLPKAFSFHQEKLKNFGSTSKADKYELVVTPSVAKSGDESVNGREKTPTKESDRPESRSLMTPDVIKKRRESFHEALLERTKKCHEEFLKTLDPPLTINSKDLKRWHPNFMVDMVPDVNPQELPQPPTNERPASAKEILERAKDFLSGNVRLQKALEKAAETSEKSQESAPEVSPEIKEKVDARLKNPLKGIPSSLLEKVRARQAAKALDAMRMTADQEKKTIMYTRLPEIARIVRTLYINEHKGVILLETVVEKVQFSYKRNLSLSEAEEHIRLLTQHFPEWLSIVHIRNADYLKMNRGVDVTSIMTRLKEIVESKKQEIKTL